MATLLSWLNSVGIVVLGIVIKDILSYLSTWITQWSASQKQQTIANNNVKQDAIATQSGDLNAIAKSSENLLNGNSSQP